jgi:hypothetical protein
MAKRNAYLGNNGSSTSGIGDQDLYNPAWANIDFADFQGLNMNLVNQNAQFAQEVANKRMENILQEQKSILEKIKLHKRDKDLQSQLDNKLSSIIDNMGNVQLSDAANYTSLNTNLIKAQNDSVLQSAVKTSEEAFAYEKYRTEHPEIKDQSWNNGELGQDNETGYQKWLNGETNEFKFNPVYKEYDLQSKADAFAKELPAEERTSIEKYGVYGLQEKAIEDKSVARVQNAFEGFKQGLMQDPEFMSWYNRRGKYEQNRGRSIDEVINNIFKSSAARSGTTTPNVKVGMPQTRVDFSAGIQADENARAWGRYNAELAAGTLGGGKGTADNTQVSSVNYVNKSISLGGDKMEKDEKIFALEDYLTDAVSITKDKDGKKVINKPKVEGLQEILANGTVNNLPPAEYSSVFKPTGNFKDNGDGTVSIEVKNDAYKRTGYIKAQKNNFEQSITGAATPSTGNGSYAGLDANGNPIFKQK